jgi:rhodanese-related sulfurtransferase
VLVDVREPDENARERIKGSRLIPLTSFDPSKIGERSGKKVIMHCKGGTRSAEACRLAAACGDVYSLSGGIEGWKTAGLPVERGGGGVAISVLRQTQMTIGTLMLTGLALGYFVNPLGFILSAIMGAGLIFAGASGTCGMMTLISKMPWNRVGASCGS